MTKIAITGASGNYGRAATDKLIAMGRARDLILMTRSPAKLAARIDQGCEVRYGDFDKPETLDDALRGAEKMLMISATRVGARVAQHQAAIDAAVRAGVQHIHYTSIIGIDAPDNPAEVRHDHQATEQLIRESGLAWTLLRDAHYADSIILMLGPNLMAAGEWQSNSGYGREAMVWRDDCVNSAVAVLTSDCHAGKIYNITGPELQTFAEVTQLMSEITGRQIHYSEISDEGQYAIFDAMGVPRQPVDDHYVNGIPWNSDDMVTFGQAVRGGFFELCTDDVERLTGTPARSVRQMIADNVDYLRSAIK